MYKAILIDAFKREVREVEIADGDSLQQMYGYLSTPVTKVDCFCSGSWDDGRKHGTKRDVLFVDDEGLYRGREQAWFLIEGQAQPLAGNGLIVGVTAGGDSTNPIHTVEEIRAAVTFLEPGAGPTAFRAYQARLRAQFAQQQAAHPDTGYFLIDGPELADDGTVILGGINNITR